MMLQRSYQHSQPGFRDLTAALGAVDQDQVILC